MVAAGIVVIAGPVCPSQADSVPSAALDLATGLCFWVKNPPTLAPKFDWRTYIYWLLGF